MDTSIGRPRIGPKVQSNVPDEVHAYIVATAEREQSELAAVVRELICLGYKTATRRQRAA